MKGGGHFSSRNEIKDVQLDMGGGGGGSLVGRGNVEWEYLSPDFHTEPLSWDYSNYILAVTLVLCWVIELSLQE